MTKIKEQADRSTSLMAGEERRRSQRVIMRIPVSLEIKMSGELIKATAHTVAVNVHGAMLLCSRPIEAETKLEIENDRTRGRASVRVTRAPRESEEGYLIPVEFVQPSPAFWQISFPPANWKASDI